MTEQELRRIHSESSGNYQTWGTSAFVRASGDVRSLYDEVRRLHAELDKMTADRDAWKTRCTG